MINPERNNRITTISMPFNIRNHPRIWDKNPLRKIVNIMQIFVNITRANEPWSHIKIFRIFRVKARRIRNIVLLTHQCRRESNRSFGYNMYKIWLNFCNFFPDFRRKWKRKLNFFITKKRNTPKILSGNNIKLNMFRKSRLEIIERTSNTIDLFGSCICENEKFFLHKKIFLNYIEKFFKNKYFYSLKLSKIILIFS